MRWKPGQNTPMPNRNKRCLKTAGWKLTSGCCFLSLSRAPVVPGMVKHYYSSLLDWSMHSLHIGYTCMVTEPILSLFKNLNYEIIFQCLILFEAFTPFETLGISYLHIKNGSRFVYQLLLPPCPCRLLPSFPDFYLPPHWFLIGFHMWAARLTT